MTYDRPLGVAAFTVSAPAEPPPGEPALKLAATRAFAAEAAALQLGDTAPPASISGAASGTAAGLPASLSEPSPAAKP